jgi:pimeloyl-ACP methyl ester carboxylesterase
MNRTIRLFVPCLALLAATAALGADVAPGSAPASPAAAASSPLAPFKDCRLEDASRIASIAARCTTLRVPEDDSLPPAAQGTRSIDLFIARIPAIGRNKSPEPLFVIAGGPGMAASTMYPAIAGAFTRLGRERDIVIVDQRGTGRSAPLDCPMDEALLLEGRLEPFLAATRACLEALGRDHDVRRYTTSVAVQDLDRVRAALGYARINLYGVSYGTRVAQQYLRRHPRETRTVILDGVVPPGLALGPAIATDAEDALERILARCADDKNCHAALGDPRADYRALRARLAQGPVAVQMPDPANGEPRSLRFGPQHLGAVLRLGSYGAQQASLLPLALHEAAARANFMPLAGLFLLSSANLRDQVAFGMHNSVVCSEDLPFVADDRVDRAKLAGTYMGTEQLDALRAICGIWPRGPVDADFRAPLASATPVLLLSGTDDPVTPPGNARMAMQKFTHARHLLLPGQGHAQIGEPCMDRVLADFLHDRNPEALDASCLTRVQPPPFFTTLAGPPP